MTDLHDRVMTIWQIIGRGKLGQQKPPERESVVTYCTHDIESSGALMITQSPLTAVAVL